MEAKRTVHTDEDLHNFGRQAAAEMANEPSSARLAAMRLAVQLIGVDDARPFLRGWAAQREAEACP